MKFKQSEVIMYGLGIGFLFDTWLIALAGRETILVVLCLVLSLIAFLSGAIYRIQDGMK